jgi:hypothetical protein
MRGRGQWIAAAVIVLGVAVAGCGAAPASSGGSAGAAKPAKVEAIAGKDVKSVTLTEQADKRLGVATTTVASAPGGLLVPYSAVIYSADGKTWVFTVAKPLTYIREKVTVANVGGAKGDEALLSAGPAAGTTIVKTGAVELYGAELGVGK